MYPLKPDLPAVGGFEGVGKVVEAGKGVTHLKPGDLVLPAINTLGKYGTHSSKRYLLLNCTCV